MSSPAPANQNQIPEQPKRDHRQEVTDSIISLLEQGVAPWQKPWEAIGIPMNPTTDKAYRGGNAVHLMATDLQRGYDDPRWMTYKQASENDWQVKKGEKGTRIEFWEVKNASDEKTEAGPKFMDGEEKSERRFIHKIYTVFNAQQIEGIPPHVPKERTPFEAIEAGERILANSGAKISHDQADRCFYHRATDSIHLPPKEAFNDPPGYYGTALHELSHWTGHPSRLNRSTLNESYRFGDPAYAREELRAELSSLFLAAETGVPHNPATHAAYVGSWIKALREDKNEIFQAATDAGRAADFLISLERERSATAQQLGAEPAAMTVTPRPNLNCETADLPSATNIVGANGGNAEQFHQHESNYSRFRPGDKIVAFEPYHYGGTPKKEPETAGIIQSVYANGAFVSYMRLDGNGELRENGNKSVDDKGLRLADQSEISQFEKPFAQLQSKYRERNHHDPQSGTKAIHEKQSSPDQRGAGDDSATRLHPSDPKEVQSLRNSFSAAQAISRELMGELAKTSVANADVGSYRGQVIAHTDLHIIQRLNDSSAVTHMKHLLRRIPKPGSNVLIQYSKDWARVQDMPTRSAESAREGDRFVARLEPGSGTVAVHDKRFGNDHHTSINQTSQSANASSGVRNGNRSELSESFQEALALAIKELGQEARTYVAQTHSGIYCGKIIGETDHHVVQRVSRQTAIAHLKELVGARPEINSNVAISYQAEKRAFVVFQNVAELPS